MSLLNKGKNHPLWNKTHETKLKMSEASKGKNNPTIVDRYLETRKKMSDSKNRQVLIYDYITKEVLYTCNSITRLAETKSVHKSTVGKYIKKNKIWKNKYIFKYGK